MMYLKHCGFPGKSIGKKRINPRNRRIKDHKSLNGGWDAFASSVLNKSREMRKKIKDDDSINEEKEYPVFEKIKKEIFKEEPKQQFSQPELERRIPITVSNYEVLKFLESNKEVKESVMNYIRDMGTNDKEDVDSLISKVNGFIKNWNSAFVNSPDMQINTTASGMIENPVNVELTNICYFEPEGTIDLEFKISCEAGKASHNGIVRGEEVVHIQLINPMKMVGEYDDMSESDKSIFNQDYTTREDIGNPFIHNHRTTHCGSCKCDSDNDVAHHPASYKASYKDERGVNDLRQRAAHVMERFMDVNNVYGLLFDEFMHKVLSEFNNNADDIWETFTDPKIVAMKGLVPADETCQEYEDKVKKYLHARFKDLIESINYEL